MRPGKLSGCGCLGRQMRVIFVNFSHYILLAEPVATVAVTAGLYGGVGTLFCVLTGATQTLPTPNRNGSRGFLGCFAAEQPSGFVVASTT